MKAHFECFSCFIDQALRATQLVSDDERIINEVLDRVGEHFREIALDHTPPEISSSGSTAPGTILKLCNKEFLQMFEPERLYTESILSTPLT